MRPEIDTLGFGSSGLRRYTEARIIIGPRPVNINRNTRQKRPRPLLVWNRQLKHDYFRVPNRQARRASQTESLAATESVFATRPKIRKSLYTLRPVVRMVWIHIQGVSIGQA